MTPADLLSLAPLFRPSSGGRRRRRRARPSGWGEWWAVLAGGTLLGLAMASGRPLPVDDAVQLAGRIDWGDVAAVAPDLLPGLWGRWRRGRGGAAGEVEGGGVGEGERAAGRFGLCHTGRGATCVVDGDTFRLNGERVRVADIDAPETHPPRCAREARLGRAATVRLQELLNEGPVRLRPVGRARDKYGRRLAVVERHGRSLGGALVSEGLARDYAGGRRAGWCGPWGRG